MVQSLYRLISTPEYKQPIGLDRNKTKSADAPSFSRNFWFDVAGRIIKI